MAGTKISEATLREQLKGTEQIPIVDSDLPKGKTTAANLKTYCAPDLSGYAKKTEIPSTEGLLSKTQADEYYQPKGNYQPTGNYATTEQLNGKVSGTGVTSIQVVSALPDPQVDGVLYIVTGEEA